MSKTETLKEIIEFAGFDVYEDYSGRGMFGKTCIGFCYDKTDVAAMADLIDAAFSLGEILELRDALRYAETDSMGKGAIMYFPRYQ